MHFFPKELFFFFFFTVYHLKFFFNKEQCKSIGKCISSNEPRISIPRYLNDKYLFLLELLD